MCLPGGSGGDGYVLKSFVCIACHVFDFNVKVIKVDEFPESDEYKIIMTKWKDKKWCQ